MSKRKTMTGKELGEKLLLSVRQMKAGEFARRTVVSPPLAVTARERIGLLQSEFAKLLGVSVRTLQDWEQNRREPSGAAQTLLKVAFIRPDAILETARE